MTKRAKTLTSEQLDRLLQYVARTSQFALRDYAVVLLSFKAGLRVGEIAGLDWSDVCDAEGTVRADAFEVPARIAKKGHGRSVVMHPAVRAALLALQAALPADRTLPDSPVICGLPKNGHHDALERVSPHALKMYLHRLYNHAGFQGCSSHSGRRTFVTSAIQAAPLHGCSIRDVQKIVGHRDLSTTEAYIESSPGVVNLIRGL